MCLVVRDIGLEPTTFTTSKRKSTYFLILVTTIYFANHWFFNNYCMLSQLILYAVLYSSRYYVRRMLEKR